MSHILGKKSFQHMVIKTLASWTKSLFCNNIQVFLDISSKRGTRLFFNNLKQMNIINFCNYVVNTRCAYTKNHYTLVMKNVVFTADVTVLCRAV